MGMLRGGEVGEGQGVVVGGSSEEMGNQQAAAPAVAPLNHAPPKELAASGSAVTGGAPALLRQLNRDFSVKLELLFRLLQSSKLQSAARAPHLRQVRRQAAGRGRMRPSQALRVWVWLWCPCACACLMVVVSARACAVILSGGLLLAREGVPDCPLAATRAHPRHSL